MNEMMEELWAPLFLVPLWRENRCTTCDPSDTSRFDDIKNSFFHIRPVNDLMDLPPNETMKNQGVDSNWFMVLMLVTSKVSL
jgi:hypothetical protein